MAKKNTSGVDADNILTSELLPKIIETLDEYKNLDFLAIQCNRRRTVSRCRM